MADPVLANPPFAILAMPIDPARKLPLNVTKADNATAWTLAAAVAGTVHRLVDMHVEPAEGATYAFYSDDTLIYGPFSGKAAREANPICQTAAGAALKMLVSGGNVTLAAHYIEA